VISTDGLEVEEGELGGLPCRALGQGQPLVYLPPFAPYHALPTGFSRSIETRIQRGLARPGFRIYQLNRPLGLKAGTRMEDLAERVAHALATFFPEPVDVLGFSTGGALSVALAALAPERVKRLVVASGAHRMSDLARAACAEAARCAERRDRRGFQVAMAPTASLSPIGRRLAAIVGWLMAPLVLKPSWEPGDAVATLLADEHFDFLPQLERIRAATLIICGDSDPSYPQALTAELEASVRGARRLVYPRTGHGVLLHGRFVDDVAAFLKQPLLP